MWMAVGFKEKWKKVPAGRNMETECDLGHISGSPAGELSGFSHQPHQPTACTSPHTQGVMHYGHESDTGLSEQ